MGRRLCDDNFLFMPMPIVSSVKDQSKLPNSLLVGGQCLDRVRFYLKPFDFCYFSLKLTKYLRSTQSISGGTFQIHFPPKPLKI